MVTDGGEGSRERSGEGIERRATWTKSRTWHPRPLAVAVAVAAPAAAEARAASTRQSTRVCYLLSFIGVLEMLTLLPGIDTAVSESDD